MRGKIVFLVVAGMLLLLVYILGTRTRDPHVMPQPHIEDAARVEASAPPVASSGEAPEPAIEGGATTAEAATPHVARAIGVAAASWEGAASLLAANGGRTTAEGSVARAAGLELRVDVAPSAREVEARLARGGADEQGADLVVMPLPALVAAFERLRALEPVIVHVVGWSRGREVLLGTREDALSRPFAPAADATVSTQGAEDASALVLALFALDLAGVPPARVHVVSEAKGAAFAALARPLPQDRPADAPSKVVLSTADASRLVPVVAVAARSFVDAHVADLASLLRVWVRGSAALAADVPAAARRIAAEPDAPDPAATLERLGWMADPGPSDEAKALAVTGHEVVTVASLFSRQWRLLRELGTLTTPAPSAAPVASAPFDRAFPEPGEPPSATAQPGIRVLLAHRVSADSGAEDQAWLAGVFERSVVRPAARGNVLEVLAAP